MKQRAYLLHSDGACICGRKKMGQKKIRRSINGNSGKRQKYALLKIHIRRFLMTSHADITSSLKHAKSKSGVALIPFYGRLSINRSIQD